MGVPSLRAPVTDPRPAVRHHFTVDVEEYFQVAALAPVVPRGSWEHRASRLDVGMRALLELRKSELPSTLTLSALMPPPVDPSAPK